MWHFNVLEAYNIDFGNIFELVAIMNIKQPG